MKVIILVLVSSCLIGPSVAADVACPEGPKSASLRLHNKLFCNYDTNSRPVKNQSNATEIRLFLYVNFFNFYVEWNMLDVHTWMIWKWNDEHLTWNHSEYDDLKRLPVSSSELWVPDVTLFTSGDLRDPSPRMTETYCNLKFDGNVTCISPTVHAAHCNADLTRWPFDSHNCSMRVGSWTEHDEHIRLGLIDEGISVLGSFGKTSREWELLSVTSFLNRVEFNNKSSYPYVSYNYHLKRHSESHAATVMIPTLVLATLTLSIFWIQPHAAERICLIWLNLLCHCLYLQYLGAILPSNGDKYPIILLFYRDSLLLVGVSLFVTLLVRRLDAATSAPPAWIITITEAVLATMPGRILMSDVDNKGGAGDDDVNQLLKPSSKDQRWHHFAVLLDRTFFLIYFLTLVILICAFVP